MNKGVAIASLVGAGALVIIGSLGSGKPVRAGRVKPHNAESHRRARPVVLSALTRLLGRKPTLAELQYGQAIGWLESNYGNGWKGSMIGKNNWGAVQCGKGETRSCVLYEDSYPDGTKYSVYFKAYDSPEDGAYDMLRNIFEKRPLTAKVLKGNGSITSASYYMRREKYYGGFCPKSTAYYGSGAVNESFRYPDKNEATRSCSREAIEAHAKRVDDIIQDIAGALNEPVAMALGSYPNS